MKFVKFTSYNLILCSVMHSFVVAVFELVELQHYGKNSTCKKTYIAVQRNVCNVYLMQLAFLCSIVNCYPAW